MNDYNEWRRPKAICEKSTNSKQQSQKITTLDSQKMVGVVIVNRKQTNENN
jgi:hypothetical protein